MSPLPNPPFIPVPGVQNFRDAGGYALTHTPGSVRTHYLYRSAGTYNITDEGKKVLRDDLGIKTIYDLRSLPEIEDQAKRGMKAPEIDGVERIFAPAFPDEDYSPESIALRYKDYAEGGVEGFTRAYSDILSHAGKSYGTILRHVRDHADKPLLLHCSGGKDRTGVIVAMILSIAGASRETIADEYALTEQGLAELKEVLIKHLADGPALKGDTAKAERMVAAKKEYMLATLDMIDRTYGGPEGYANTACGLTADDIATLRTNMQSDQSPRL